jgi:signal transduction histidine kinase
VPEGRVLGSTRPTPEPIRAPGPGRPRAARLPYAVREGSTIRSQRPPSDAPSDARLAEALREIERLRARLAAELAEREELVTIVSHELRTPLTVIAGFNKLLLSERVGPLNDEQRRFLGESDRSCRRLDAFIGNLIEAARQSAREGPLELCEASLETTVRGVVQFLRPVLEERGLRAELRLAGDAARARFHPLRIEQVLTNLIGNAARYAAKGGRIEIATRLASPGFVEVSVSDDGPGVPAEDRERIFRPWVRGRERAEGGLGLGLAICRRLVEAHGGEIDVVEAAGGGARFRFTVPAAGGAA